MCLLRPQPPGQLIQSHSIMGRSNLLFSRHSNQCSLGHTEVSTLPSRCSDAHCIDVCIYCYCTMGPGPGQVCGTHTSMFIRSSVVYLPLGGHLDCYQCFGYYKLYCCKHFYMRSLLWLYPFICLVLILRSIMAGSYVR